MNNLKDEILQIKQKIKSLEEEVAEKKLEIEVAENINKSESYIITLRNELVSLRNEKVELIKKENIFGKE